jgi:hypothetical protein
VNKKRMKMGYKGERGGRGGERGKERKRAFILSFVWFAPFLLE